MIEVLRQRVAAAVRRAVEETTGRVIEDPPVEDPPRPEFGDLACPAALQLARELERNPRQLAQELLDWLSEHPVQGVRRWTLAGPGYLNAFLDRGAALLALVHELRAEGTAGAAAGDDRDSDGPKVVVEHTSINPNKAAHIGHLRNACLGDILVRLLRHQGWRVEVQNYIDDTGVQVADVVLGLIDLRGLDAAGVAELADPFDHYCWDLYAEVTARLEDDEGLVERRREVLLALERGTGVENEVARVVVDRICRAHLETMGRLGIGYDVLIQEGDVVGLDLWAEAFERLEKAGQLYYAEDAKHEGCWMMRLSGVPGFEELQEADKVLVRSNGTTTYVAKDIAYHMWKYGLLERGFRYERFGSNPDGSPVWRSVRQGGEERPFGRAARTVNVIDVRQAYLQSIVALALAACGVEGHTHFDYEFVALTPATAEALGIPLTDDQRQRARVEMSGRRGHGVKGDDLMDALEERAAREITERNPEIPSDECLALAREIAVGAIRYFLVKFTRKTVIAFDLDEALSFEGETGPYLQYSAVRARHIFEKMRERWGVAGDGAVGVVLGETGDCAELAPLDARRISDLLTEGDDDLWRLVLTLGSFHGIVDQAVDSMEISGVAKYAFGLAQEFSQFYHRHPILNEDDREARSLRTLLAWAFSRRFEGVLELLGMPVPERM